MIIKMKKSGEGIILYPEGRLDSQSAPPAQEALLDAADQYDMITIDAEELKYVSSAGLRVFLLLQKKMIKKGGTLALVHVKPEIKEVFEMTGFSSILNVM